jgi:16S rRNA (cytosine967-C5)-methyltransferase
VAENETQVEQFLAEHPQFTLEKQQRVGFPEVDADTMFVARLQCTSEQ